MRDDLYIPLKFGTIFYYIAFVGVALYSILESSTSTFVFMSKTRLWFLWIATICCVFLCNEVISSFSKNGFHFNLITTVVLFAMLFASWLLCAINIDIRVLARIVAYVFDIFVLMVVSANDDRIKKSIRLLLVICLIICLVNDFVDITGIVTFPRSAGSILKKYVVGTKFTVVYLHLNTFVLFFTDILLRKKFSSKKSVFVYTALAAILGISIYVDCSTGILGSFVYAILFSVLFLGKEKNRLFWANKFTFVIFIISATFIFLVLQEIVSIPAVTDFIINKLNRDPTLTGRLIIFALFIPTMNGHWLWGYGLGKAHEISMLSFGVADAQNLVLQWVLQIGIIPVIALIIWLMSYFARVEHCSDKTVLCPIMALLYTYIFMGIGEITMNYSFFMYVFLLACIANYQKRVESLNEN